MTDVPFGGCLQHDPTWEPKSEAIWTTLEAAKKLTNALNVQQHVIKAKMPLAISSQAFLRNVFRAGIAFGRLAYLASAMPYRQLDEDDEVEGDERDVPAWGASVAEGAREGLARCVRMYADVEKWMRGIDRKAPVVPSFPKSSPLRVLETLLWKVETGFVSDLPAAATAAAATAGTKRKRFDFEEAELVAQGLLLPYLEGYGGVWVIGMALAASIVFSFLFCSSLGPADPGLSDSDETESEAVASIEIVGQGVDHLPPAKKFKKSQNKVLSHSTSEPIEVTDPELQERERARPNLGHHRASGCSVFTVRRKRDKHVAGEASLRKWCDGAGHQTEGSLPQVKVEGTAPIGWQRHHQDIAELPPDIIRAPEDPVQNASASARANANATAYVSPTSQGPQTTVTPATKYYGHAPSAAAAAAAATPQQHVPPKIQPQLRVDTTGVQPGSASVAHSPAAHYIPHSGISAPSASASVSAETWSYHTSQSQYGLPTPQQQTQQYPTPGAVQAFNSSYHTPDGYPPPPESQMHPHHRTPEHPVAFEDPQYAHATPAPLQMQAQSVYQAGQSSTGVSPQPAIVYQYPPQPVNGSSMPPHAHHAHPGGSAPRGTGYGLAMSGYPTQPQHQPDVQSVAPRVQTYTPTAQGTWDQSGQDHLAAAYPSGQNHLAAAYPSGLVQPIPMSAHSGFDQDLQPQQQPMEMPYTMPAQPPWDPTTSTPAPNAYASAHSY